MFYPSSFLEPLLYMSTIVLLKVQLLDRSELNLILSIKPEFFFLSLQFLTTTLLNPFMPCLWAQRWKVLMMPQRFHL